MMAAYYNEFDEFAASWLRHLIKNGEIADGEVDTRSVSEVTDTDIKGFTQCHFFAGIGGWSRALRLAGWPDDRPVWTGSCPCQPFSSAGNQKGKDDDRHLWPVWFQLIRKSRPPVVLGEQVSSAIRHHWWDDVADDLESEGYATRAEIRPASSVGAPHKRDRLWFMADTKGQQPDGRPSEIGGAVERPSTDNGNLFGCASNSGTQFMADTEITRPPSEWTGTIQRQPAASHWENAQWADCPDGKQKLIEPSICLLANGVRNRVGKMRGYGNAIVPQVAAEFIKATYQPPGEIKWRSTT